MIETILTVSNYDLQRLNSGEAVAIFSELLWAEADAIGIQKSLIDVPSALTVADGGVDAEVSNARGQGGQGIIQKGLTRYQIKTGDFKLSDDSKIKEILFRKKGNQLKPRIQSCLDKNGTLVVVLFGWDNPEKADHKIIEKFRQQLSKVDNQYKTAKLRIFKQNNLISFFKPFPSLALKVNRRALYKFKTHSSWANQRHMRTVFEIGDEQKNRIDNIREELRRSDAPVTLHIDGEAGIGKTRIVLEATKEQDLAPLVIYNESARTFRDSDLMNELVKDDHNFFAIVVVDECDATNRSYIWNQLASRSPNIKLVTIYNEDQNFSGVSFFDVPALGDTQISRIIQSYDIPEDQSKRYKNLCDGSPRVAHVIGQNLRSNPQNLLKPPAEMNIWERYIVGSDDATSEKVHQKRCVLGYISLFKRFGYGKAVAHEAQFIAQKVKEMDTNITWAKFQEIIYELKSKKTLQGETTLYISPKALHIWLWREWWDKHGVGFDVEALIRVMPPKLREWFGEMFIYARDSTVATKVVKELLGPDGPFQKPQFLRDELGSRFFLSLTTAHPDMALTCLERTIGTWDVEKILEFREGRRNIIWALERIVVWKDLFSRAASLLLSLAEGENESYSNNASGIFAGLYSPGYGKVAPTEASPEERFRLLKKALESDSKSRRLLALKACDIALESRYFSRSVGAEIQGLRAEPELWKPKIYAELWDAYRRVWRLLEDNLPKLEEDEKLKVVEIFMQKARGLVSIQNLSDLILDTLHRLGKENFRNPTVATVNKILLYDESQLPEHTVTRLRKLRDDLTGTDFRSLLRYYVAMNPSQERFYKKKGKEVGPTSIGKLAQEATSNTKLIVSELGWLTSLEAQNSYAFGYELAKADVNFSLLPQIIKAQKQRRENTGMAFLGGYFRGIHEKDHTFWEKQLQTLMEDDSLNQFIPELIWRSESEGLNDSTARLILELFNKNIVSVSGFRLFCYGSSIKGLSEKVFTQWLQNLLQSQDKEAASITLNLVHTYYIHKASEPSLPEKLISKVLTNPLMFNDFSSEYRDQTMSEYLWAEITDRYLKEYPEHSLDIASSILEYFGVQDTIFDSHDYKIQEILNKIVESKPNEVWNFIARHLSNNSPSAFHITEWLKGDSILYLDKDGVLSKFPKEKVFGWVDEDVEVRAWYLANFIPKTLTREAGKVCWVREILQRYGDRKDVRRNLSANFSSESWTGHASLHYQQKKEQLLDFRKNEDNERVRFWIDEYIAYLDEDIERAQISEERGGY